MSDSAVKPSCCQTAQDHFNAQRSSANTNHSLKYYRSLLNCSLSIQKFLKKEIQHLEHRQHQEIGDYHFLRFYGSRPDMTRVSDLRAVDAELRRNAPPMVTASSTSGWPSYAVESIPLPSDPLSPTTESDVASPCTEWSPIPTPENDCPSPILVPYKVSRLVIRLWFFLLTQDHVARFGTPVKKCL